MAVVELYKEYFIAFAMRILETPRADSSLIKEALTAAHRGQDSSDPYQCNGNRELAGIGQDVLKTAIRYGKHQERWQDRHVVWTKLLTIDGLHQIAQSSRLIQAIFSSAWQCDKKEQARIPRRVAAYAVRSLLAAVYLSSNRSLEHTCEAIDALSRYLDHGPVSDVPIYAAMPLPEEMDFNMNTETATDIGMLLPRPDHSIIHTSSGGEQVFVQSLPHVPMQEPADKPVPVAKSRKRSSRPVSSKALDDYIKRQKQLYEECLQSTIPPWLSTCKIQIGLLTNQLTQLTTLRKLYHGTVSAQAVLRLKQALQARRSEALPSCMALSVSRSAYHYQQIQKCFNAHAQTSVATIFHIYKLYISLRGDFKAALDDGFINTDPDNLLPGNTMGRTSLPGNPKKRQLSRTYERILSCIDGDWDYRSEEDRTRLSKEMGQLWKLGERIHSFVAQLGMGAMSLLLVDLSKSTREHILVVSEAEFCALPETEKRILTHFIQQLSQANHPIAHFASAAEPILQYLFDPACSELARLQCEMTETSVLSSMAGGSSDLLAQLFPI